MDYDITEIPAMQALMEALGSDQGPPDFEAAAEALDVTVEALQSALGME